MRSLRHRVLDLRDALFGLIESAIGYFSGFLIFLAVLAGFLVAFGLWRGVTTVKFTNESAVDLENITVTARSLEGDEGPLWQLQIPAGDVTHRFTFGCCDYIVVKHRFKSYDYQVLCRYPDWEDFPEFSVVVQRSGSAYCVYPRPTSEPPCTRIDLNAENPEREICPDAT